MQSPSIPDVSPRSSAVTEAAGPEGHAARRLGRALGALALALVAACGTPPGPAAATGPTGSTAPPAGAAAPELYGAGLFSTGAWDFFVAFTPDQRGALFCRADDKFRRYEILETRLDAAGRWSRPRHPRFATQWSNADPHISPDGSRVYFVSNRPGPGETAERATYDVWVAALGADGAWGDAERLPAAVNDAAVDKWSPSVAASGTLYFGAELPGGHGGSDLWMVRRVDGVYRAPENLGEAINTAGNEVEPWIAPDESYLIFSALDRSDSLGSYDLYVSRKVAGRWTPARRLAEPINSRSRDFNQSVSPDGRWLYFSSTRPRSGPLGPRFDDPREDAAIRGIGDGKTGDIYRVAMSAVE